MYFRFGDDNSSKENIYFENIISFSSQCIEKLYKMSISDHFDASQLDYIQMTDGNRIYSTSIKDAIRINSNAITENDIEEMFLFSNTNKICFSFKDLITKKESTIIVSVGRFCKEYNMKKYKDVSFQLLNEGSDSSVAYVQLDPNGYSVSYANRLEKYITYYEDQIKDIEERGQNVKIEIDLDMMRVYNNEFLNMVVDDKDILIPIKTKFVKIKSFKIQFLGLKDSNNEDDILREYSLQNCTMKKLSPEDTNTKLESFEENYGVVLPERTTFIEISCEEYKQKEDIIKYLFSDKTAMARICFDVAGELARLKRIKDSIKEIMRGNVENENIAEIISTGKSLENFNNYKKDEKYCNDVLKRNPILKDNEEQITTIDKIMQMDKNGTDILLVQGPPGTGKTELITALCNEFEAFDKTVLVTSNVQVACNNIVERVKNNKEMILKRYENTQGERYAEEILKNKKTYVVNQIFNKFKVDKKVILSNEDLSKEKLNLESLVQSRENLIAEDLRLKKELKDYFSFTEERELCLDKILQEDKKIENIDKQIEVLSQKLDESENVVARKYRDIMKEKKSIDEIDDSLKKEIDKLENLDKQNKEIELVIGNILEQYETLKTYLANQKEITEKLEKNIKNRKMLYEKAKAITRESIFSMISNYVKVDSPKIFPEKLLEINPIVKDVIKGFRLLNNYLIQDDGSEIVGFVPGNDICNTLKFEFDKLYFENEEDKKICSDYITYKTEVNLIDKIIINLFKKNRKGFTKEYIKKNAGDMAALCHKIVRNTESCVERIIDNYFTVELLENFVNDKHLSLQEAEQAKEEFLDLLTDGYGKLEEFKLQEKTNRKTLSENKQRQIQINNKVEDIKQDIEKQKAFIKTEVYEFKCAAIERNKIYENIEQSKNELNKIRNLIEEIKTEVNILERKIENERLLHVSDVKIFDEFHKNYDQKLKEIEKSIVQKEKPIKFLDESIKVVGEDIIFEYLKELKEIEETKDDKLDGLKKYFDGFIDSFDDEFRIDDDNWKGSIISMTTSQIAKLFNQNYKVSFDYAIVDEASKCSFEDLSIIVPRVKKLVLIGDYMQLEPIFDEFKDLDEKTQNIFANDEKSWVELNRSSYNLLLSKLIEDNEKNNIQDFEKSNCVGVMKKQFRMNKGIFDIVSPIYSIHNGFEIIDMKKTSARDVICFNIDGDEEPSGSSDESKFNVEEIDFVIEILKFISKNQSKLSSIKSIGIIAGYAYQVRKLKNAITKHINKESLKDKKIECGTFDRFQGREYDLVIVSMVRTESLGFLKQIRRMNVAMSRAKKHLIIIGNFSKLKEIAKNSIEKKEDPIQTQREERFVRRIMVPMLARLCKEYASDLERIEEIEKALVGGIYD